MKQHRVDFFKVTSFSDICYPYLLSCLRCKGSSDNGKVGFVLYQNDKLFQSRIYQSRSGFSKHFFSGNIDGGRTSGVEIAFSPKVILCKKCHVQFEPVAALALLPVFRTWGKRLKHEGFFCILHWFLAISSWASLWNVYVKQVNGI